MDIESIKETITENKYYKENRTLESGKRVDLHLKIEPELKNELTKLVAVYREYDIDRVKLNRSVLISTILTEFFNNFDYDELAILELIGKVKSYRESAENGVI